MTASKPLVMQGTLVEILVGPKTGEPMRSVARVRAVAGRGLEGDRNFADDAKPAESRKPEYQATLIEEEAVKAVARETGVPLAPSDTRRNLVTRGVALNHWVGREFTIGGVRFFGHRLCEPCKHLESLTRPGLLQALLHRGGLRAEILEGGELAVGQVVSAR